MILHREELEELEDSLSIATALETRIVLKLREAASLA